MLPNTSAVSLAKRSNASPASEPKDPGDGSLTQRQTKGDSGRPHLKKQEVNPNVPSSLAIWNQNVQFKRFVCPPFERGVAGALADLSEPSKSNINASRFGK